MTRDPRSLTLVKGAHRYVFRYEPGRETELLAALMCLASDPQSAFDWFDAALLSFQIGQQSRDTTLDPVG